MDRREKIEKTVQWLRQKVQEANCKGLVVGVSWGIDSAVVANLIKKAYPNIFVVKYEENDRNVTYSYTDVLTRTVEVEVFDGDSYSPLIPPPVEVKKRKTSL